MAVHLSAVQTYDAQKTREAIEQGLKATGAKVDGARTAVIKINVVQTRAPETGIVTHPVVAEALIDILKAHGVIDIAIAEAPALGVDPRKAFRVSGYTELCKRKGVRLINLFDAPREKVDIGYGYANLPNVYDDEDLSKYECGWMSIPKIMLESDLYINLAKLKTHNRTTVTLTMKNQWGLLSFKDRQMYHRIGLHEPIVQIARAVQPHITVVDGILALEGNGPILGVAKHAGLILVGTNMVETDITGARLMGADPKSIIHLQRAVELGLGNWDVEVLGEKVDNLAQVFDPAPQDVKRNHNFYVWRNYRACHLDDDAFHSALKIAKRNPKYWMFLVKLAYYSFFKRIDIVRGRGNKMPQFYKGQKIIVSGDCARDLLENYEELPANVIHIPGCPPDPEDIIKAVIKM